MKLGLGLNIKTTGSEFTPDNISSLTHWYKFNEGITTYFVAGASNNIVTEWQDAKGSNHLVDTMTPANTSAYNIAHPKLDSGKVVFDHGGDQLDFTSHLSLGTFAIYIRASFASSVGSHQVFEDEAGSNFVKIQSSTEARFKISGARHDFTLPSTLAADTTYNIGWEREDTGSTTDDVMQVYVNAVAGSFKSGGTGDGTEAITNTLDLEKIGDPANAMHVTEIVICNNALSASDRTKLNTYFNKI